jgi:hypothetical protein
MCSFNLIKWCTFNGKDRQGKAGLCRNENKKIMVYNLGVIADWDDEERGQG